MFNFVFLDADDTLLDFLLTERAAITESFQRFGLSPTDDLITQYSAINKACWERMERGEITRDRVLIERFEILFARLGADIDPRVFEGTYQALLGQHAFLVEGAEDILAYLRPKYKLYIASNGVAATQDSRFRDAGLTGWFDDIFISERIGHHKPEKAYFDACFAQIPGFRRDRAIIVGDSLSSDILGGINAGIATCWFNYRRRPARDDIRPDYTINTLEELKSIL